MVNEGWEEIYKEKGEVYSEVNPKIKKYAEIFKEKGYKKVLDLCCGTGRHSIFLAKEGFSVYATDISEKGVEILKRNAKKQNLSDISCKVHNMNKIPYLDDFFDAIICTFSMGHGTLDDAKKTIDEMYRTLKVGGMVITDFMSTKDETYGRGEEIEENTFLGSMEEDKHMLHHYFDENELKEVFSKFKNVKISAVNYFGEIEAFDVEAVK